MPNVGDVVLFCLHEEPLVLRPFLVTDVYERGDILGVAAKRYLTGQLFYGGIDDRHTDWARGCKTPPAPDVMACWVVGAREGSIVGTWRKKE